MTVGDRKPPAPISGCHAAWWWVVAIPSANNAILAMRRWLLRRTCDSSTDSLLFEYASSRHMRYVSRSYGV